MDDIFEGFLPVAMMIDGNERTALTQRKYVASRFYETMGENV